MLDWRQRLGAASQKVMGVGELMLLLLTPTAETQRIPALQVKEAQAELARYKEESAQREREFVAFKSHNAKLLAEVSGCMYGTAACGPLIRTPWGSRMKCRLFLGEGVEHAP
jgi:hypothetical protein